MRATEAAPAAITSGAVASVMPPIATTGRVPTTPVVRRTASSPTAACPVSLVRVSYTGPIAR